VENKDNLISREQYWIDKLNSYEDGYNMCPIAGSTLGKKISEKTSKAISDANKNRIWTLESRKKLQESQRNRDPNNIRRGYKLSDATKEKLSIVSKGRSKSKEHKDNLSKTNFRRGKNLVLYQRRLNRR